MKSEFAILTSVYFSHEYFAGSQFNGIVPKPTSNTERSLLSNGLLYKPVIGGFTILFDKNIAGRQRTRQDVLKESGVFSFKLSLADAGFYTYTANLPADSAGSVYYFSNFSDHDSPKLAAGRLHIGEFASEKDALPLGAFKEKFFTKPFGQIDLEIGESLEEVYQIRFRARSSYWRYILVSSYLTSLNSPAIIAEGAAQQFDGPQKITLPDNKEALAFTSQQPIMLSRKLANTFQLVENYESGTSKYKVVMQVLPVPDSSLISYLPNASEQGPKKDYSEIFIH